MLGLTVFLIMPMVLFAEEPPLDPSIPGRMEGAGTYFEIKDSEYLNISLQSTEEITILLESVLKTISLHIEASTSTNSTTLTIGGLESNKTYYKFEDSYKNKAVFVSDNQGSYTWTQGLILPHHIWLQETEGTIFLPDDCNNYGVWNATTSTCTLNQNLTENVEITANITLDCAGHSITGSGTGWGVYASYKTYLNVKNCKISNFSGGIYSYSGYYANLTGNELTSNWYGVSLYSSHFNTMTNNKIDSNHYGIYLPGGDWSSWYNNFTENTFEGNINYGLFMPCAWSSRAGMIICNSQNSIWQNEFYKTGVYYGGTNSFCNGVGNYYAGSVLKDQIPTIDCGPTPNNDIYIDQTQPTSFEWNAQATYTSIQEAFNNLNTNRTSRIVEGTGPYLEKSQTIRNYTTLDCQNEVLKGDDTGDGIYITNSNTTIKNCQITDFSRGVYLRSSESTLLNNTLTSNEYGIYLYYYYGVSNNTITSNNISLNRYGISLSIAHNNALTNNKITSNEYGIYLFGGCGGPRYNNITGNTLKENTNHGLYLGCAWCDTAGVTMCADGNNIYHNNFIYNYQQARDSGTDYWGPKDLFDNGYPLDFDLSTHGGNYWSDYTGLDEKSGPNQDQNGPDKIGDTPYVFTGDQDRYPFMRQDGWKAPRIVDVKLIWSQNIDRDFSSYKILKNDQAINEFNPNLVIAEITNQSNTVFVDQDVVLDRAIFYRVFVFDKVGLSMGGNEVFIK